MITTEDKKNFVQMFLAALTALMGFAYVCGAFVTWNWIWPANIGSLDGADRMVILFMILGIITASVMVAADFTKWCRK